jgi:hypothetical protein
LLVYVDVDLGVKTKPFKAAFQHSPRGIRGIGRNAWMRAGERDTRGVSRMNLHGHPLVERECLINSRELMEPIRAQGTDCQA